MHRLTECENALKTRIPKQEAMDNIKSVELKLTRSMDQMKGELEERLYKTWKTVESEHETSKKLTDTKVSSCIRQASQLTDLLQKEFTRLE